MVAWKGQPKATKAELEHMARVKELPCCICVAGEQTSITEVHHLKLGNKRMGHFYVIPLCSTFHHPKAYQWTYCQRALWQSVMDDLGIVMDWPTSRIVSRRAV